MKILAVCGFGVGSSMVLKFTIEKAAAELGLVAEVENTDLTSAQSMDPHAIFTSYQLVDQLKAAVNVPVFPVRNYMDQNEVKAQLAALVGGAP